MDIQSISVLAEKLEKIGFSNMSCSLLKKICFKPVQFFVTRRVQKGTDQLTFILSFAKVKDQGEYDLRFYDAMLQKKQVVETKIVNGIDVANLDKRMNGINWQYAFDPNETEQTEVDGKEYLEEAMAIEEVIDDLAKLETGEGKAIAGALKFKYWYGTAYRESVGNIATVKAKDEVSQRFYKQGDENIISVNEAYRFLQNKWMEKQMLAKKKSFEGSGGNEEILDVKSASGGTGLLRKTKISKRGGNKKSNRSTSNS